MQVDGATAPAPALGGGLIDLIKDSSPISQIVLAILVIFSVVSWGIILYKLWTFNHIQAQSNRFLEIFRRSTKFSEVQAVCQSLGESPLVGIFLAGYAELNLQLRQAPNPANSASHPSAAAARPMLKSLVSVDRALMRASNVETNKLEKHITFLATTAAVTPFIGLFGTVLGIISAFQGIGVQGSTSLDVVAPGIADALIATAAGLACGDPRRVFLQSAHTARQSAGVRNGRLLPRISEHRRAELHVMPKVQSFDHEKGGHSRRGRRTSTSLAEINVVPLVDVMLVLLIIFMVTAPMMQRGVEIQLPVARRGTVINAEPVYVTLPLSYRKDRRVLLGPDGKQEPVALDVLGERARQLLVSRATKQVYLRMDAGMNAQEFLTVMDSLKDGGVEAVGLVALDAPREPDEECGPRARRYSA